MPKVLIITGLANRGGAQYIQLDLQSRGYHVDTNRYYDSVNVNAHYRYVIAHSAGSYQATIYAKAHPEVTVFVMGAIVDSDLPNIISVGEYTDIVAVAGLALSGNRKFDVHTSEIKGLNPHSKNEYYDAIKDRIPYVLSGDYSGFVQNPRGE